jgi:hypothetical protein
MRKISLRYAVSVPNCSQHHRSIPECLSAAVTHVGGYARFRSLTAQPHCLFLVTADLVAQLGLIFGGLRRPFQPTVSGTADHRLRRDDADNPVCESRGRVCVTR